MKQERCATSMSHATLQYQGLLLSLYGLASLVVAVFCLPGMFVGTSEDDRAGFLINAIQSAIIGFGLILVGLFMLIFSHFHEFGRLSL